MSSNTNLLPEDASVALYKGPVMHARMRPKAHRFSYATYAILVDVDAVERGETPSPLFSINRFNLFAFDIKDHGAADGSSLRSWAEERFEEAGVEKPERLFLLCYPRILGFVFNPLSVFYAYDGNGHLSGVIYEVRNTFGERHSYIAGVHAHEWRAHELRQSVPKRFHVSPFMDLEQTYHFRMRPPAERINVRILETDAQGPMLAATFTGERRPAATLELIKASLQVPFLTLKVVAAIHFEAARLWLKGVPFFRKPAPPAPSSLVDGHDPAHHPGKSMPSPHGSNSPQHAHSAPQTNRRPAFPAAVKSVAAE